MTPIVLLLSAFHPPPQVIMSEGGILKRRSKKLSNFPPLSKKWEIFPNFFVNSGKNLRQRSSLGRLAIETVNHTITSYHKGDSRIKRPLHTNNSAALID